MDNTDKNLANDADRAEILKFSASGWWQGHSLYRMLHVMNPARLTFIHEVLTHHWPNIEGWGQKRVLDIGCGGAILSLPLKRMGFEVCGIDLSENAIIEAQKAARLNGLTIDFQCAGLDEMRGETFDAIFCLELIEHLDDPEKFLRRAARMLTPSGMIFISTLKRNAMARIFAVTAAENWLGWLPKGTHDWHKFINPSEIMSILHREGLHYQDMAQMVFSPLTRRFFLTRHKKHVPNYILAARKFAENAG